MNLLFGHETGYIQNKNSKTFNSEYAGALAVNGSPEKVSVESKTFEADMFDYLKTTLAKSFKIVSPTISKKKLKIYTGKDFQEADVVEQGYRLLWQN